MCSSTSISDHGIEVAELSGQLLVTLLDGLGVPAIVMPSGSHLAVFRFGRRHDRRRALTEFVQTEHWLTLRSYLHANVSPDNEGVVALHAGYLNAHSHGVRYCLVDGVAWLQAEVPMSRLSRETLTEALWIVGQAAASSMSVFVTLAASSTAQDLYKKVLASPNGAAPPSLELESLLEGLSLKPVPIERFAPEEAADD